MLQLGKSFPRPNKTGRPTGYRDERYGGRKHVDEVHSYDARDFDVEVGEREHIRLSDDSAPVLLVRHRYRGRLWVCPCCERRTRLLYETPDEVASRWGCRNCAGLVYPSQVCTTKVRREAAALRRRRMWPRTLECSRDLILFARCEILHRAVETHLVECAPDALLKVLQLEDVP